MLVAEDKLNPSQKMPSVSPLLSDTQMNERIAEYPLKYRKPRGQRVIGVQIWRGPTTGYRAARNSNGI